MPPSASFDVLGTCFHFHPAINHIQTILSRIPSLSIPSPPPPPSSSSTTTLSQSPSTVNTTASSLFHSWFYAAQRDFTYLSLSSAYTPIIQVLKLTFRRAAHIVGVPDVATNITDEDIDGLMGLMRRLPAREGLGECFERLRGEGWGVVAVTNGGREGTMGYFEGAGVQIDGGELISCDEVARGRGGDKDGDGDGKGVAKPDPRVYGAVNSMLDGRESAREGKEGKKGTRWFVAAHSWDLIAARKAGFRTAWVGHEEGDSCKELFGEFDVYAKDLRECAEMMLSIEKGEQ